MTDEYKTHQGTMVFNNPFFGEQVDKILAEHKDDIVSAYFHFGNRGPVSD